MKGSVKIIGNSKAINALALKNVLNGEIASALYASAEEIMTDSIIKEFDFIDKIKLSIRKNIIGQDNLIEKLILAI